MIVTPKDTFCSRCGAARGRNCVKATGMDYRWFGRPRHHVERLRQAWELSEILSSQIFEPESKAYEKP